MNSNLQGGEQVLYQCSVGLFPRLDLCDELGVNAFPVNAQYTAFMT